MKKIINDPANVVDEMLDGWCAATRSTLSASRHWRHRAERQGVHAR